MQYFGNMRYNSTALDNFAEVVNMMNHTGLLDADPAWYSWSATHWIASKAWNITLESTVGNSTNGPGDRGSTPGRVILETLKMVLGTSLLNTQ